MMDKIEISITISENPDKSISIHSDLPLGASAIMVCDQLANISDGILRALQEHINTLGMTEEEQARAYVEQITLGDLAGVDGHIIDG